MTDSGDAKMGIWMTSALVVGTIIGAAIFMLPVALAPLGANALIGWLVSGIGIMCIAYALAQLSRLGGDGIQANIEREFGPTMAFLAAWAFWVSNWVAQASVAVAIGSTASFIVPELAGHDHILQVGIGCVVFLTAVNAIGVRASGGLSIVTVAIKVVPLLAVIWLAVQRGASGSDYQQLAPVPIAIASIATATALTFFALTGFEGATAPVCKVRDASRTIPRAILGGTAFVALLYLLAGSSIQLLLPANAIVNSPAPFADAMVSRWGQGVAVIAALAISISAFGCLNGLILATGELGYSMALRGDLPSALARTHGANTPIVSQLVASGMTILLLLANTSRSTANLYTFIVLLSAAGCIVLYFISSLAAWKSSQTIRARSIVILALLFTIFAAYGTGLEASLWCLVLLAAGLAIRAVMRRLSSLAPSPVPEAAPAAPRE